MQPPPYVKFGWLPNTAMDTRMRSCNGGYFLKSNLFYKNNK